jgi:Mg/Co/Ni transporter MgtE
MTRTQAIAQLAADLGQLPDERIEVLAELARTWTEPTVFSRLSPKDQASILEAFASVERGEGLDYAAVKANLQAKLRAAGA